MKFKCKLVRNLLFDSRFASIAACLLFLPLLAGAQSYQMSVGDNYGAIVDDSGNLFVWGGGQGGTGGLTQILPAEVWQTVTVSRTDATAAHYLAIRTDGTLWAWGNNDRGQLGLGDQDSRSEPVQISSATNWVEIAVGSSHSLARNSLGLVFAWGDNTFGQLNVTPIYNNPVQDIQTSVPGQPIEFVEYISIAAGNAHSHGIRADGTLWAWGSGGSATNGGPELGILVDWDNDGAVDDYPVGPVGLTQVGSSDDWTQLFGGFDVTYALRDSASETGQLWAWGAGGFVGNGSLSAILKTPTRVGHDSDWVYVSRASSSGSGNQHALALKSDGTLWGWGSNYPDGQLGLPIYDGNGNPLPLSTLTQNSRKLSPVQLEAPDTFLAVGAGDGFSAVIRNDGFLLTAGRNDEGQLANGFLDETPANGQDFFDNSQLGVADLVAVSVTVNELPENVGAGEIISVSFEVQNIGTGAITDTLEIEAWLNTSPTVGGLPLDFDIGVGVDTTFEVTDDFAAGQSRSIQFEVELPNNIPQGSYYIIADADTGPTQPIGAVAENDENNNDAATDELFDFLPDLIVPLTPNGLTVINTPGDGTYDPGSGDTIDVNLFIENIGNGTLPLGSSFDVRIFLSPDRSTTNSAIVELNAEEPVTLTADLEAGQTLATALSFSYDVPRMPAGFFFVGVELDINSEVVEQPEILDDNDIVVQPDGEANNSAFTDAQIEVTGLTIIEAVDQELSSLVFTTDGDGDWFGQSFIFNADGDAAQSPSLAVGESAEFSTSFNDYFGVTPVPVAISFDWRSETSSAANRLFFRVINGSTGGNNNEISGNTNGWVEDITRVIPVNGLAEWVYEQGVEGVGDAVYVDDLQVTEITQPDLVIDDIYLPVDATGSYVLQRDSLDLTVNSRNQGTDTSVAEDYVISIYLSPDPIFDRPDSDPLTPDDILIRQVQVTEQIFSGDPAVNGLSITLDTDIDPGQYYVIGYIDDYTDENGNPLSGATQPSAIPVEGEFVGNVDEFTDAVGTSGLFPGEDNNLFISDIALVEIVALADLQTSGLTSVPNFYYINDPASGYTEPNSLSLNFTLVNEGLGGVNEPIQVAALFSRDQNIEPSSDYVLLDFNYSGNFGTINDAPANTRFVSPDEIDFRENLVSEGYIGERLFLGVFADSTDVIDELDEDNNSFYLFSDDFILSELEILDGLDVDASTVASLNITVINDEQAPYDSSRVPWVGQTTETFDNVDAVASVIVGDNESSEFSIEVDPAVGVRTSFWWKVSSQNDIESGARDQLEFKVYDSAGDLIREANPIFGVTNSDWSRVEVVLDPLDINEPGPYTLTWTYVKDSQGSVGDDRGWVDRLTITELPNLTLTGISVDGSVTYQGGDTIDTWSVEVQNTGESVEPGTAFDVELRMLPNSVWSETGAITLLTITDATGIGSGETRSYSNLTDGSLTLPVQAYSEEFYYFGAYVDWLSADPSSGQVSESDESVADNAEFTSEASLQIGRPDIFGSASSIAIFSTTYGFGDSLDVDLDLDNIGDGSLAAGASFNYSIYITRTDEEGELMTSSSKLLGTGNQAIVSSVASGASIPTINFSGTMPFGLADGAYYIGVVIDTDNDVEEQGLAPDGSGVDGENNNIFFSSSAILDVGGASLYAALDDGNSTISFEDGDAGSTTPGAPFINQGVSGAALWFGRDNSGDAGVGDNASFVDSDGAQTPELQLGEFAEFSLTVDTSSLVRFDWRVFSGSDLNILSVLVNDVEVASISGDEPLAEVDPAILVPVGGVVTWRYSKGAAVEGDFALVDDLRVETNNDPDLVLSALNYTAGEYILDIAGIAGSPNVLLGTEYLDITVEAVNVGEAITATNFTTADIEVRLSTDDIFGNDNDIVLGTFSQIEGDLGSGSLIRFIGPIQLGDSIPEGTYYLMARIDSNDQVTEFSENNNVLVSAERDVQISRLPALRLFNPDPVTALDPVGFTEAIDGVNNYLDPSQVGAGATGIAFDVDEGLLHFAESTMRLRYSVQNIGLDSVAADQSWNTRISLLGAKRQDLESATEFQGVVDAFSISIELGDFDTEQLLLGRSELNPNGTTLDYDIELALPNGARFNDIIDDDLTLLDYLWIVQVELDANDDVPESEIIREEPLLIAPSNNPWWIVNIGELILDTTNLEPTSFDTIEDYNTDANEGAFAVVSQALFPIMTEGAWEAIYDGADADEFGTNAQVADFLAYAFNRNPSDSDTLGPQFPGTYGITDFQGEQYLSISFDFVTRAADLVYRVEADSDVSFPSPDILVVIDGPYDELTGTRSLTGDGGLIEGYIDGPGGVDPEPDNVLSVLDQGYSARITVRDTESTTSSPSRFMRVVVESVDVPAVP